MFNGTAKTVKLKDIRTYQIPEHSYSWNNKKDKILSTF